MSEDGKNILKMVEQIRKLCEQISLLLRTADEQMGKEGWEAYNNVVLSESSASLLAPEKWFPHELFRFYKNGDYPHLLAYVSVLLDSYSYSGLDKYEEELTEPLVTAGFFDYGQGKQVGDNWEYWYSRWYGYMEKRKDDGTIHASEKNWHEDGGEKDKYGQQITMEQWKKFEKLWDDTTIFRVQLKNSTKASQRMRYHP